MSIAASGSKDVGVDLEALVEKVESLEDRVEALEEENEELREENKELRKEVTKNEDKLDYVQSEIDDLEEKVDSNSTSDDKDTEDINYEIERLARLRPEDKENLTANRRRAVDLWKELPRFAREVKDEFVLTPKELAKFLMEDKDVPLEQAKKDRETQRRIKEYMNELSGGDEDGTIRLEDRSEGWFSEKKNELSGSHRIHVKKGAWRYLRKHRDVERYLGSGGS